MLTARLLLAAGAAFAALCSPAAAVVPEDPLDVAQRRLAATHRALPLDAYPDRTMPSGEWHTTGPGAWTSGFLPGTLWLLYQATGDPAWRSRAEARQAGLESQKRNTRTHDVGFMLFGSFGNGHRLTGVDAYRRVALAAAGSLAERYSPVVRSTRSWNNPRGAPPSDFRVIVDNLMNLELLFWASKHGGGERFREMATQHALRTAADHVRPDGGTFHLVVYDAHTGAVKARRTVQGYRDGSTWSRGQAWALHGFTIAYRETAGERLLDAARKTADYFVAHLPPDSVPYWDFQAPGLPDEPRDSSAAAIGASGLLELARLEPDPRRGRGYRGVATGILGSLSSPAYLSDGAASSAILLHGTQHRPAGNFDTGLVFGDYYFVEALLRHRAMCAAPPGGG